MDDILLSSNSKNQTEILLKSLERDQGNREGLENLVRLASEICGVPAALINFVDDDHQLTCFSIGWEKKKIPKEESICQFTVEMDDLLLIPDTGKDDRLKRIIAVRDDPRIGFYAGVPFKGVNGYSNGTLCVIDHKPRQLTDLQKRALKTLASEVESRLELILGKKRILKQNSALKKKARFLKNSADVMLLLNIDDLTISEVHSDINAKLGYTSGQLTGRSFTDFCGDSELSDRIGHWFRSGDSKKYSFEIRFKRKSKAPLPMLMHASRVEDDIYLTGREITEQKRAEKKIQNALDEKRTMLAEIHHRVKNNLAIVSGLLEMEYSNVEDKRSSDALLKSVTRIKSMAMIHEKLYTSEDFSNISFSDYVTDLVDSIQELHQSENRKVEVKTTVDPLSLNINQAIPCALILNELITNAFKHAFEDRQLGRIEVKLYGERDQILMRVQDDGRGMPESVGNGNGSTLGLTLLDVLTKQLKGEYRIDNGKGTAIEVAFRQEQEMRGPSGNRSYQRG